MRRPGDPLPPPQVRWAGEAHYRMLGSQVCVQAELGSAARTVDRLLAPFRCPPTDDLLHRYSLTADGLYRDGVVMERTTSWPTMRNLLLGDLNRLAVDNFNGFAVHAGVVARGDVVVAFPAASGAGKSTLTAACLAAGCQYVSDEALCFEFGCDAVLGYPKPLKLSRQAAALAGLDCDGDEQDQDHEHERVVLPDDLAASLATGRLRLGHVVQLVRWPGSPRLDPADRSETIAMLLTMSFNHYRHPESCFSLATRLARRARAWRLRYDDPRGAAALLRELLDDGF